jgi:hypothetical protein
MKKYYSNELGNKAEKIIPLINQEKEKFLIKK